MSRTIWGGHGTAACGQKHESEVHWEMALSTLFGQSEGGRGIGNPRQRHLFRQSLIAMVISEFPIPIPVPPPQTSDGWWPLMPDCSALNWATSAGIWSKWEEKNNSWYVWWLVLKDLTRNSPVNPVLEWKLWKRGTCPRICCGYFHGIHVGMSVRMGLDIRCGIENFKMRAHFE